MIEALVLDFDGVIVDTETPLFHAWAHTYATFGAAPIEHADWCTSLGRNESDPLYVDPLARLLDHVGSEISADEIQSVRRAERDRLLADAPPAPGLDELLESPWVRWRLLTLERGWSHATREVTGEADDASLHRQ